MRRRSFSPPRELSIERLPRVDMNGHKHSACRDAIAAPSRRFFLTGLAAGAISPAVAHAQAGGPASSEDVRFMRMALDEARQGDFPFGAVIVRDGSVIARGRNLGRTTDDPTAHGEMGATRRCLADHGSAALRGSTLYTSGEPCAMCMGAILWCHLGRLVFAASVAQMAPQDGAHAHRARFARGVERAAAQKRA